MEAEVSQGEEFQSFVKGIPVSNPDLCKILSFGKIPRLFNLALV
jgi:hypothetical protein